MAKAITLARWFLGLVFLIFGLNGLFQFFAPPAMPEPALRFIGAMGATGYFFRFEKATEILFGIALLANRYVPLSLTVLAPIVINILLFHIFLAPRGLLIAIPIVVAEVFLAYAYSGNFKGVLEQHATPSIWSDEDEIS